MLLLLSNKYIINHVISIRAHLGLIGYTFLNHIIHIVEYIHYLIMLFLSSNIEINNIASD